MSQQYSVPPGQIVITSHGSIRAETALALTKMAEQLANRGVKNIEYTVVLKSLVDKARNDACRQFLQTQAQWLWFIDGDMLFEPDIALRLFETAFHHRADADIVGGYCQLRSPPYLPTIDRGSGLWESHDAHIGPLDVIRTGAACLLIKRHVLEAIPDPWFGTRPQMQPRDIVQDFDGYTRQRFDGRNPFNEHPEWHQLMKCAFDEHKSGLTTTGEDSGFCDRAKAYGFTIVVETGAVMAHIDRKVITPKDHQDAIRQGQDRAPYFVGACPNPI